MLCKDYISNQLHILHKTNTVHDALALKLQCGVPFFAVEEDNKFLGIVALDDLQQLDEEKQLQEVEDEFIKISVKETDHILTALKLMQSFKVDVIAVTNSSQDFLGEISQDSIIDAVSKYLSVNEGRFGLIALEVLPLHYSITELTKLVQANDAEIMQLNTYLDHETGNLIISIMVNKTELSALVATFQRYEYHVRYYFGEENYDNKLQANYDLLMKYINL